MDHVKAVLRRATVEQKIKGSAASRDAAIEQFLTELQVVITPPVIEALDATLIGHLYEDWLRALPELSVEEREQALIRDVSLSPVAYLVYRSHKERGDLPATPAPPPENVVFLHKR